MTARDSKSRLWEVTRDLYGNPELTPIGHDTDPDSDDLSRADEEALLALLPDDDDDPEPLDEHEHPHLRRRTCGAIMSGEVRSFTALRIIGLKTGDLISVGGKVRQVLNNYPSTGFVELAYLGGDLLPVSSLHEFHRSGSSSVFAECLKISALEAAGGRFLCEDLAPG
jgi:hypothetical protein